jgi:hypothetical protein
LHGSFSGYALFFDSEALTDLPASCKRVFIQCATNDTDVSDPWDIERVARKLARVVASVCRHQTELKHSSETITSAGCTGRKLCSTTTLRIAGLEFPKGFTLAFKSGQHDSRDDGQDYCSSLSFEELVPSQLNPAYEKRGEDGDLVNTVRFAAFTKGALQVDIPELSIDSRLYNEDGINESWLELHSESALLVVFATPTLGS